MPAALVTLPDGKKARITFTDQAQLDATVSDLVKQHPKKQDAAPAGPKPDSIDNYRSTNPIGRGLQRFSQAVGEPALAMATGAATSAIGGVEGLVKGGAAAAGTLAGGGSAADARNAFSEAGNEELEAAQSHAYRPKSATGKKATEVASTPFTLLSRAGDAVGRKTAEVTGSPALGAAANTLTQSAPALLDPLARGATSLVRNARVPPAAAAEGLTTQPGAPRQAPSTVGDQNVPQGTPAPQQPPAAAGTPPPAAPGAAAAPPQPGAPAPGPGAAPEVPGAARPSGATTPGATPTSARAQAYASRIGLDWSRLGAGTRKALETIAQDATALDKLNPAAVRRQAHLEGLRVPVRASAGQLNLDPVQLRREAITATQPEGQPIRDIDSGANRDVQANLEVLRGRLAGRRGAYTEGVTPEGAEVPGAVRAPTKAPSEVGQSTQGVLRDKAKWSKKAYQALYKRARETEPDAKVPTAPMEKLLESNPEIQHLGWVQGWLKKAASVLPKDAEGNPAALTEVTLNELHDLRSQANDIARTGGKEGHYAGQVVKAIDESMQNAPEGAAAWKKANAAFKKHQEEFADQGLIRQLTTQRKGGADRALGLEKTWKTISSGTAEQIRQVKQSLLKGDNPALRKKGAEAWRDIRAETVNRILEDARNVASTDTEERATLTAAALTRSIKRIPRENLEEILGKGATRELMDILRARRITRGRTTESGTVPNALVMVEKVLDKIPGIGKYAAGGAKAVHKVGELGETGRSVRSAQMTPLQQAVEDVQGRNPQFSRERRLAGYRQLEDMGPTIGQTLPP